MVKHYAILAMLHVDLVFWISKKATKIARLPTFTMKIPGLRWPFQMKIAEEGPLGWRWNWCNPYLGCPGTGLWMDQWWTDQWVIYTYKWGIPWGYNPHTSHWSYLPGTSKYYPWDIYIYLNPSRVWNLSPKKTHQKQTQGLKFDIFLRA